MGRETELKCRRNQKEPDRRISATGGESPNVAGLRRAVTARQREDTGRPFDTGRNVGPGNRSRGNFAGGQKQKGGASWMEK